MFTPTTATKSCVRFVLGTTLSKFRLFQHSWTVKAVNAYREVIGRAYQDWRRRTGVDRDRSGEERGRVVRHQGPLVEL